VSGFQSIVFGETGVEFQRIKFAESVVEIQDVVCVETSLGF